MATPLLSVTFRHLLAGERKRYSEHQGGTRSSKTYSILQYLIYIAQQDSLTIDVFRRWSRTHDKSTIPDFQRILSDWGIKYGWNAVSKTATIGKSIIRFSGADDLQKLRGPQRDIAFLNEATEFTLDLFDEINQRTSKRVILDFNPWAKSHWVYKLPEYHPNQVAFWKTTYRDNPALTASQISAIEAYQTTNPAKWRIYGLGERVIPEELVYPEYNTVTLMPEGETVYGVDFGSTSPTAVVQVTRVGDNLYVRELVYETNLSTAKLGAELKRLCGSGTIYCDAAEPDRIKELQSMGLQAVKANKSVQAGIAFVQNFKLHLFINDEADNLQREADSYSWKRNVQTGVLMDEVVKADDHLMDAMRYGVYSHWGHPTKVDAPREERTAVNKLINQQLDTYWSRPNDSHLS